MGLIVSVLRIVWPSHTQEAPVSPARGTPEGSRNCEECAAVGRGDTRWVLDSSPPSSILPHAGLMIVGLDFEEALEGLHDEMDLLENKRVLIDAKGTDILHH